jgi:hypothetical protein
VLEVMNDARPPVRGAAIEALGRAIIGALGSLQLPATTNATAALSAGADDQQAASDSDSTGGVEHMLLVALEALYNGDTERDVRSGVLRVLISVLQVGAVDLGGGVRLVLVLVLLMCWCMLQVGGEGGAALALRASTLCSWWQGSGCEHLDRHSQQAASSWCKGVSLVMPSCVLLPPALQRHGERLSDGWTPVFRLLAAVPTAGEGDAVDLAFQSVQLTCGDYMAAMPFARLKRCLEVAVLYSSQQADVNVSLTTISLLWNAADLFGKAAGVSARRGSSQRGSMGPVAAVASAADDGSDTEVEVAVALPMAAEAAEEEDSGSEDAVSPGSKRSQLAASLSPAQTEELLHIIFLALQVAECTLWDRNRRLRPT